MIVLGAGNGDECAVVHVFAATPDMGVVDALAHLYLAARHMGLSLRLRDVSDELREVLELAGLRELLAPARLSG